MGSRRQARFESLFQEELGSIFLMKGKEWFGTSMIAISEVRFSEDLRNANVYVSLHGIAEQKKLFQRILERRAALKKELGKRVRHQLRKMPEVEFHLDDSIDRAARIDELLND